MREWAWYIKASVVALGVWASINGSVMLWQMALNVWVASVQAPQAQQQAQKTIEALSRQLEAERAKPRQEAK